MNPIPTILKAVLHVEEHLQRPLSVGAMAESVGYSLYHFARTFNRVTHHTPYDYLVRRRLSDSVSSVVSSDRRIIDIAYDYRFAHPETYTRGFRRLFGCTPSQARGQGHVPFRRLFPPLTLAHLTHRAGTAPPHVESRTVERIHLVGLMTLHEGELRVALSELWRMLTSRAARVGALQDALYAVVQHPPPGQEHRPSVFLGYAHPRLTRPESGLVAVDLPGTVVAHACTTKPRDHLPLLLDYLYHTWMPVAKSRPSTTREVLVWDTAPRTQPLRGPDAVRIPLEPASPTGPASHRTPD